MLNPWLDRAISEYSLGTRAKIAIAAAMLGGPQLLIFDESLNGLDPVAAWEFKQIIRELAVSGGQAILVATHVVEAVPSFCTRAVLLSDGRIAASWNEAELAAVKRDPAQFEEAVIAALRGRQRMMAAG
jgi:ABC-2 type transport system ATP-binding protein